jgi:hypothetical protein
MQERGPAGCPVSAIDKNGAEEEAGMGAPWSAQLGGHRIPVMRSHLPARDHRAMDPAPVPYMIRIHGHLGATVLSAFPALAPQHQGAHTCSPACWTTPHCMACWQRSRRSAWTCSRSESSAPTAVHQSQATAATATTALTSPDRDQDDRPENRYKADTLAMMGVGRGRHMPWLGRRGIALRRRPGMKVHAGAGLEPGTLSACWRVT